MFFIKHHGKRVDLAEHEVYTYCPQCGKVHTVDLIEMAQELPDFDLFSPCFARCKAGFLFVISNKEDRSDRLC